MMTTHRHIAVLDVVRGVAALTVLLTHLSATAVFSGRTNGELFKALSAWNWVFRHFIWCNGGLHAGVVVFIVLSGFCIHWPLAKTPTADTAPGYWKAYAIKRAKRILPVYWFSIALGATVSLCFWPDPQPLPLLSQSLAAALMLPALTPRSLAPGNEITQTVAVEFILYALYPFGLAMWRRFGWCSVIAFTFGVYAVNAGLTGVINAPVWMGRNVACCLFYWYLGALAASLALNPAIKRLASWRMTATLYVAYFFVCHLMHFKGAHFLKSALLALVTAQGLLNVVRHEIAGGGVRFSKLMIWTGMVSYSLYVCHMPALDVMSRATACRALSDDSWLGIGLLACVALSVIVFLYVEQPTHKWAQQTRRAALKR